jgi:hypothetical protein
MAFTKISHPSSQVVVGSDEPQDMAMKRFRREVMSAGLVQEVSSPAVFLCSGGDVLAAPLPSLPFLNNTKLTPIHPPSFTLIPRSVVAVTLRTAWI